MLETPWATAGHLIAWDQFQVAYMPVEVSFGNEKLQALEAGDGLTIQGRNFKAGFCKKTGTLVSYIVDGKELLAGPFLPDFWRAYKYSYQLPPSDHRPQDAAPVFSIQP